MYTFIILLGFLFFDIFNKRSIPIKFIIPLAFGAMFVSNNLFFGCIELIICLVLGFIVAPIGIGYADSIEIALLCLISPFLIGKYTIPLIIPLWLITIGLGLLLTLVYQKGNQPLTLAVLIARAILLI